MNQTINYMCQQGTEESVHTVLGEDVKKILGIDLIDDLEEIPDSRCRALRRQVLSRKLWKHTLSMEVHHRPGAESVWMSDREMSEREHSGGGGGGLDGGCKLGLLGCGGLHLCDGPFFMLLRLGLFGRRLFSLLAVGSVGSLSASEDSSM